MCKYLAIGTTEFFNAILSHISLKCLEYFFICTFWRFMQFAEIYKNWNNHRKYLWYGNLLWFLILKLDICILCTILKLEELKLPIVSYFQFGVWQSGFQGTDETNEDPSRLLQQYSDSPGIATLWSHFWLFWLPEQENHVLLSHQQCAGKWNLYTHTGSGNVSSLLFLMGL